MRRAVAGEQRALVTALFDFSFTEFVTPRIIRTLYGLAVAVAALLGLLLAGSGFLRSPAVGLGMLFLAGLLFLFLVAAARIGLEAALVFFRIAEDVQEVAEHGAAIALNTSTGAGRGTDAIPYTHLEEGHQLSE